MGDTQLKLEIRIKDESTRREFKKIVADGGFKNAEELILKLIEVYNLRPDVFKRKFR